MKRHQHSSQCRRTDAAAVTWPERAPQMRSAANCGCRSSAVRSDILRACVSLWPRRKRRPDQEDHLQPVAEDAERVLYLQHRHAGQQRRPQPVAVLVHHLVRLPGEVGALSAALVVSVTVRNKPSAAACGPREPALYAELPLVKALTNQRHSLVGHLAYAAMGCQQGKRWL